MSAKYSTSPALHLRIGKSRVRCLLHSALCLSVLFALLLLHTQGYTILAFLLALPVCLVLWQLRREIMAGAVISWQRGNWTVERDGNAEAVCVSPRSAALPWVIYLGWRELAGGRRSFVWLFVDSASQQQLRELRVRLSLEP